MLIRAIASGVVLATGAAHAQPMTMTLNAASEATIFSDPSLAVGEGRVFVGNNFQNSVRRGLVRFDLSSLPEGEVVSATLGALVLSQRGFDLTFNAHRLLQDWNEGPTLGNGTTGGQGGPAGPTDATWTETGLGSPWTLPGGAFLALPTGSGSSQFAGDTLGIDVTADVRLFRDGLANHGWILVSQTEGTTGNVVALSTDDFGFPSITLTVVIEEECRADTNGDGIVSPQDFNAWIQAFNAQSPACDQNGDGLCTPQDFNAWIVNFNNGC